MRSDGCTLLLVRCRYSSITDVSQLCHSHGTTLVRKQKKAFIPSPVPQLPPVIRWIITI